MALWKTQPTLRLLVGSPIRIGEPFVATLEIEASEPVEVEWVDLTLQCVEGWAVGSGKNRVSRSHRHPSLAARVVGAGVLSGTTRYEARFEVPVGQPPSHEGGAAYVRYSLHAQASIPWWPDARVSWPLVVRDVAIDASPSPAVLAAGASEHFEVSLESQRLATTGIVGGIVALKHPWDGPPIVDVTLREVLRLVSWNGYERTRHGRSFSVPVTLAPVLGSRSPFRFRFEDVPPTFTTKTFRHDWELVFKPRHGGLVSAIVGAFGGNELAVPMQMVESPTLAARAPSLVAPSVGDARMQELLGSLATASWHVEGMGLERELPTPYGAIEARVEWVAREDGTFLHAKLEPPALGLGLRIGRGGFLDALAGDDVLAGVPGWDERYRVDAREPAQARAFLAPLVAVAGDLLVGGTDEALELERPDPAVSRESLALFVSQTEAVLAAVAEALAAIPPPRGTTNDRPESLRVARLARGTFHPGDLALHGWLEDRALHVSLLFEGGEAVALQIDVGPVPEGTLRVGSARDAATLAALPEAVRPIVASLPREVSLAIEGGRARAWVAATKGAPFGVDHERAVALGGTLVLLARSLGVDQGPFR
jgi:hypothetical protein